MLIRLSCLVLTSILAVSCASKNVNYSGIASVGFSNGMGDKLNRVRIGTTVFNNHSESVNVESITPKVTAAAVAILGEKVKRVESLNVPTSKPKFVLFSSISPLINADEFRERSIEAAKTKGLDAVWICYPSQATQTYGARGPGASGYEHRQDSFLSFTTDAVHFSASLELIDVRSGKTLRTNHTSLFGSKPIETEDWIKDWSSVSSYRKKVITDGITEVSHIALREIMD
jgi:hypothetical protein